MTSAAVSRSDQPALTAAGFHFDGRSASRRDVTVRLASSGLTIAAEGTEQQYWPVMEYRIDCAPGAKYVRFERLPYTGEAVVVEDPEFARACSRTRLDRLAHNRRPQLLIILLLVAVGLSAGLWVASPWITARIAEVLPPAAEERRGAAVSAGLAPDSYRLSGPEIDGAVTTIVQRLSPSTHSPWPFRVAVTRSADVNAWAAPGGHIAIFCGLVHNVESPDELAAVLAHEMTHVTEHHSTQSLIRTIGTRLGLSILLGGGDSLLDTAAMLGSLHHMRGDEESADRGAFRILVASDVDPLALTRAFERLEKAGPDLPGAMKYLSSHPPVQQRRKWATEAARSAPGRSRPVLTPAAWRSFVTACKCDRQVIY